MTSSRYALIVVCTFLVSFGIATARNNGKEIACELPDFSSCDNGRCLSTFFLCDGDDDCGDNSDERNCPGPAVKKSSNATCSADQFQCEDKTCIAIDEFCDRSFNCPDKSDEYVGCTEKKICKDFRCKNGYCMKNEWVCDGFDDCLDNSDELNCENRVIPADQCNNGKNRFLCTNGRCISLNKTCNQNNDCGDNSDEDSPACKIAEEGCQSMGCSHKCNKTPRGAACSCPIGYQLVNNKTCSDINECMENDGLCDQRCVNNAGSYACICDAGYELLEDARTCKVEGGEALMIFSSKTEIRGFYLESEVYFPIKKNLMNAVAVSLDGDYIYWSEIKKGDEVIMRSREDGTNPELIVTAGLGLPEDIEVDWITGNVYFTDSRWKHIGVCKNNGEYCAVIIKESMDMPRGLALNPARGELFWSDFGEKPHISRAGMDGKDTKALVTENLGWPNGLAIDYPKARLYWVEAKLHKIESVRFDGTDRRLVLRTTASHPFSIAIFENNLYWSDWDTKTIESADKYTGKNRTTIIRESDMIHGIHIYHSVLKPKMPNPCNSQPCSELCLLAQDRQYSCTCTPDKELSIDRHTCKAAKKKQHLIIVTGDTFIDYHHEILGTPKMTGSQTLKRITHAAYDAITGSILANDQASNTIFRFDPVKSTISAPITSTRDEYLGGMDFDEYGNNIYWTDPARRCIEIYSLETHEKTILHFLEEPHDILVIPKHGLMFVVFHSSDKYHIDKLQMSGAGAREHVIEALKGPKISLAYDPENDRVFWADEYSGRIESFSVQGDVRKSFRSGIQDVVSLAVVGSELFWTHRGSKVLQWADKNDRIRGEKRLSLIVKQTSEIMNLVARRGKSVGNLHKCRINNGGCSHVCVVAIVQYHYCACPPGMILNPDKRTCSLQTTCTADQVRCSDNNECISKMRRCNGVKDCQNGEDEEGCDRIKSCGLGEFTCESGQCIAIKNRCNSVFDCDDKSDEAECDKKTCKNDEFQCLDGQCITKFNVCDGKNDCQDFSDETNCGRHICDAESFRCASGNCIPKSWECDGQNDCDDSSDESPDVCKTTKCNEGMFRCKNKICIDHLLRCNKVDDCGDRSDEEDCEKTLPTGTCTQNEYKCTGTEKCISMKLRCNSIQDCPKNDDEHGCTQCETNEFGCENKKCIPQSWICDGVDDCGDESDETNCDLVNHKKLQNFTMAISTECEEFKCQIGTCLPYEKVCDGNMDCFDGSDEGDKCSSSCSSSDVCEQLCQNTPTGILCRCHKGYSLGDDGRSCKDIDECSQEICPQVCHNLPGSFSCSCYEGYVLRSNRISCKVAGKAMEIITATKEDIRKISSNLRSIEIIRQSNAPVNGLDVNTKDETIYWSNELLGAINRVNLKTEEFRLISGLGTPGVLAVDWSTDNVYFNDRQKPASIKVCSIEDKKCAEIVSVENYARVMSIALDPKNGWLFWGQTTFDVLTEPEGTIYRTDMSGSNLTKIADERIGVITGVAIDHSRSHIYWADALLQVVERSDIDGGNRQIFLKQEVHQPLGINIFEDSIYWLMGSSGIMKKCSLRGDKHCESINVKPSNVNDLFVLSQKSRQPQVSNVCENHDCDYMCVPSGLGPVCICPKGYPKGPNATCADVIVSDSVKFESVILGLKNSNNRGKGGLLTGVTVTVLVALAMGTAYFFYQRKNFAAGAKNDISFRFRNPTFGRGMTGMGTEFIVPVVSPGEHEYTNPMTENPATKVDTSKNHTRRVIELISPDHSENELEDIPHNHETHLIR